LAIAVVIIAIVRIIAPPGIGERSTKEKSVIVKSTVVEPAIVKSIPVEPAPIPVKATKSTAVEPPHLVKSAAVKTPAATPAKRPGIGELWLTEHAST
jgi:hypothetical protein